MSETQYYQVKDKKYPDQNGVVIRFSRGKLECLTGGDEKVVKLGCTLSEGRACANEGYFLVEISEDEALKREKNYVGWRLLHSKIHLDVGPAALLSIIRETIVNDQREIS